MFFECLAAVKKTAIVRRLFSFLNKAGVAKLADALDSKSGIRKDVWVRTPPPAYLLIEKKESWKVRPSGDFLKSHEGQLYSARLKIWYSYRGDLKIEKGPFLELLFLFSKKKYTDVIFFPC